MRLEAPLARCTWGRASGRKIVAPREERSTERGWRHVRKARRSLLAHQRRGARNSSPVDCRLVGLSAFRFSRVVSRLSNSPRSGKGHCRLAELPTLCFCCNVRKCQNMPQCDAKGIAAMWPRRHPGVDGCDSTDPPIAAAVAPVAIVGVPVGTRRAVPRPQWRTESVAVGRRPRVPNLPTAPSAAVATHPGAALPPPERREREPTCAGAFALQQAYCNQVGFCF